MKYFFAVNFRYFIQKRKLYYTYRLLRRTNQCTSLIQWTQWK